MTRRRDDSGNRCAIEEALRLMQEGETARVAPVTAELLEVIHRHAQIGPGGRSARGELVALAIEVAAEVCAAALDGIAPKRLELWMLACSIRLVGKLEDKVRRTPGRLQ